MISHQLVLVYELLSQFVEWFTTLLSGLLQKCIHLLIRTKQVYLAFGVLCGLVPNSFGFQLPLHNLVLCSVLDQRVFFSRAQLR